MQLVFYILRPKIINLFYELCFIWIKTGNLNKNKNYSVDYIHEVGFFLIFLTKRVKPFFNVNIFKTLFQMKMCISLWAHHFSSAYHVFFTPCNQYRLHIFNWFINLYFWITLYQFNFFSNKQDVTILSVNLLIFKNI